MSAKSILILALALAAGVVAIAADSIGPSAIGMTAALGVVAMTAADGVLEKTNRVRFKVKLDHFGHIMVECQRGTERVETGLRGLPSLVNSGLMRKPKKFHVDPLQRAVEIDRFRIECNESGARQLEDVLNSRYALVVRDADESVIDVKENPAASTGFDIRFMEVRAGSQYEVKGHLSQEILDLLQDRSRCGMLQPEIAMRISPPFLVIRRKAPDGTEERIPELPDVPYLRITPMHLQRVLNHPAIRRHVDLEKPQDRSVSEKQPLEIREIRVSRNPQHQLHLWIECLTGADGEIEGKSLTHHNVADLQRRGVFRDDLDVTLTFDQRTLSILHKPSKKEMTLALDLTATDDHLAKVSQVLTEALKRSSGETEAAIFTAHIETGHVDPNAPSMACHPNGVGEARKEDGISEHSILPAPSFFEGIEKPSEPALNSDVLALFQGIDPSLTNVEVFRALATQLGLPVQDVRFSLPCVFESRRFEIISSSHPEVGSVLDLRLAEFTGFYLSHLNENRILLVYACNGRHVEFGPKKCELRPAISAEPACFKNAALLGLVQNLSEDFVFIVTPAFKEWVRAREKLFEEARVRFATVNEIATAPQKFSFIWPDAPGNSGSA